MAAMLNLERPPNCLVDIKPPLMIHTQFVPSPHAKPNKEVFLQGSPVAMGKATRVRETPSHTEA